MKQQVNFYTDEFKPKKDLLSFNLMLLYWLIGTVLISALYPYESEKMELAKRNYSFAQQQEDTLLRQLNALQASFSSRGDASELEFILEQKTQSLIQRQQVLSQLGLRTQGMEKGVAGILEDLAKTPIDGLWLTEIGIYEGQLSVVGFAANADQVPLLVAKLQGLPSLKNKRFAKLVIQEQPDKGLMMFSLQSENRLNPTQEISR
jgi:Tfp pilus assembly protein PilN